MVFRMAITRPPSHGSRKATGKIGTGSQHRIAVHHSADFLPFTRDARSKHVWVWEGSTRPQGCQLPDREPGCNRAGTLVIHENDATWGDLALRHLERRRDGAIGKQPFSTAQRQRKYLEPERIDQIMLHQRLKEINPASPFAPAPDHSATEEALRELGVAFTSLRNGYYASSAAALLGNAIETGEAVAPEDGPVSWASHDDLARAAAITLTKGGLDGITPALTGSEALDLAQVAEIVSEVTGRPIRRVVVSDEEFRSRLVAHGTPEQVATRYLGYFLASRQGEFSSLDPTLARLIGRPLMTLRDVVKTTLQTEK